MRIIVKAFCKAVLVVLVLFSVSHARVLLVPIEKMPSMADFVVVGTVIESNCRWDERGVMIFTDYTIDVEVAVLGNPGTTIMMSFSGGTVGERSIYVTETPRLRVGETYLLFGLSGEKSSAPVVGREQGVFRVLRDTVQGKEYIVDYNGYLLEALRGGKIIRGPLVDLEVTDRLALKTFVEEKKVVSPTPVIRDASGKIVPQERAVFAGRRLRPRGRPVEKSTFIDFILERASEKEQFRAETPEKKSGNGEE